MRITIVTRLEVGYFARSAQDLPAGLRQPPVSAVPDLIIAATAGLPGLTVLHYDKDFDLIASITGQPIEWLNAP